MRPRYNLDFRHKPRIIYLKFIEFVIKKTKIFQILNFFYKDNSDIKIFSKDKNLKISEKFKKKFNI